MPTDGFTDAQLASFTALSDVMCTGYHAAVSAGVKQGDTVAVVGDGAVGLSAVLAAKLLGASRIIALSRHADRQALAKEFGATDIVAERGDDAVRARIKEGKTRREIVRCLKRYAAREVFHLVRQLQSGTRS
ncbi:zinc-binding dehydrogenase [Streptomyces sp. NPDC006739]|uniref:zinc-binding dehydrogenase n=1 Tax=Streptomyces sp. NPDC006739 TaxID=3364763 RepID=UPI003685310F